MKRLVSIFLSLMILLCCVVPVSATTSDISTSNFLNITSFCENRKISLLANSSGTFRFVDLPLGDYVYIDAIVYSTSPLTSPNSQLNIMNISGNYYRIYGYNSANSSTTVSFTLNNTNATSYYLYNCYVSTSRYLEYELVKGIYGENGVADPVRNTATSASTSPYITLETGYNSPPQNSIRNFYSYLYVTDYQKYDYIDYVFTLENIYSLDSITVKSNNGYIFPFTINYVTTPNGSIVLPADSPNYADFVDATHIVTVSIRVDIRGCERIDGNDYQPFVMLRGQWLSGNTLNYDMKFTFHHATGYINTVGYSTLDLFLYRITNYLKDGFSNLADKLSSLISGRSQDQSAADSFNDSIDDQSNELEDLTADLNAVTRPPITDVNLSSSGMVDSGTIVLATSGIGSIMSNTIILRVLLMALTFALAGFILFGKR